MTDPENHNSRVEMHRQKSKASAIAVLNMQFDCGPISDMDLPLRIPTICAPMQSILYCLMLIDLTQHTTRYSDRPSQS